MKITVWARDPWWDQYYYGLFKDMAEIMPDNSEMHYIIYDPISRNFEKIKKTTYTEKLVGLMIIEELQYECDYTSNQFSPAAAHIIDLCNLNPNTQFIIFTEIEYFNKEVPEISNLRIVPVGTGIMFEHAHRDTIIPVTEKNLLSTQTFVSLNRSVRPSRVTLLSYLLGTSLADCGYLSFNSMDLIKDHSSWLSYCPWGIPDKYRQEILDGFELLKVGHGITQSITAVDNLYNIQACDNVTNFNEFLRSIYKNTFVEIVSETTFTLPGILVTEKTKNSIYGYNFPIFVAGKGIVNHLKNDLGLDMFDDIIDHSYDTIEDNVTRITTAIDSNKRLLTDSSYIKSCWQNNFDRFTSNVHILRTQIEKFYRQRAWSKLTDILRECGYN
jgi:hypothetical protein